MKSTIHTLIKKYRFIAILCSILTIYTGFTPLHAEQTKHSEISYGTLSGDYVIYRDYSWKNPTWIGFAYYDDETYGAFLYTPLSKSRISILFSTKKENDTLVLTGQKIISPITPDDTFAVNYLMTLLPKLYELRTFPKHTNSLFASGTKTAVIDEFGGSVSLHFESYIPLFHLKTLKNVQKGTILEFIETGTIQERGEHVFYGYFPPEPKQLINQFSRNKKAKKETVTAYGIPFHLDSQWKKIADSSFLCGDTAFLTASVLTFSKDTQQALTVSEQLIRFFISSSEQVKILLPHTVISGTTETFTLEQSVYDVQLHKINKDIKKCIKNPDGSYTIISLTIDSHAYSADQDYFNSLF